MGAGKEIFVKSVLKIKNDISIKKMFFFFFFLYRNFCQLFTFSILLVEMNNKSRNLRKNLTKEKNIEPK